MEIWFCLLLTASTNVNGDAGDGVNDAGNVKGDDGNGDWFDDFFLILVGVTQPALVELCITWL